MSDQLRLGIDVCYAGHPSPFHEKRGHEPFLGDPDTILVVSRVQATSTLAALLRPSATFGSDDGTRSNGICGLPFLPPPRGGIAAACVRSAPTRACKRCGHEGRRAGGGGGGQQQQQQQQEQQQQEKLGEAEQQHRQPAEEKEQQQDALEEADGA